MNPVLVIATMAFASILGAMGSILLKQGAARFNLKFDIKGIISIVMNWRLVMGATLYFLASVLFIWLLRTQELSLLYPMTSLTYVFVTFFSAWILRERINKYKVLGIAFIILGVVLVNII